MMEDLLTPDAGFAIAERDGRRPRRSAGRRGTCPTSCSAWCATGSCCGSTHRRSTPSSSATGCCTSAARTPTDDRRAERLGGFTLRNVPLLSRVGADRADELRTDVDAALAGLGGRPAAAGRPTQPGADLRRPRRSRQGRQALGDSPPSTRCSSAGCEDGRHVWAVRGALEAPEDPDAESEVLDLRRAGAIFDDVSAQLVATATALLNWHDSARFSADRRLADQADQGRLVAGQPGQRSRGVPAHRPRGDLPGARRARPRGAGPPDGVARAAVLAARRIRRGGRVVRVVRGARDRRGGRPDRAPTCTYLGSQPWPFPRSLMVGFHAHRRSRAGVRRSTTARSPRRRWFTRAEVRDGAERRRLEQRLAVAAAAARVDLDRPGDHRVLGVQPGPASPD